MIAGKEKAQSLQQDLSHFRIVSHVKPDAKLVLSGRQLLTTACESLLAQIQTIWKAPSPSVAASLLIKRNPYPIAFLYAMSVWDTAFPVPLEELSFAVHSKQVFVKPDQFPLHKRTKARSKWRNRLIAYLLQDHLIPLISSLARKGKIKPDVLWAHVAFNVDALYRRWIKEYADPQIKEDYLYLTRQLSCEPFGLARNPFQRNYAEIAHPLMPNETIRLREKCCLNFCIPGEAPCHTCPRITETERMERIFTVYSQKSNG